MEAQNTQRYLWMAIFSAIFFGTIGSIAQYAAVAPEAITFYRLFFGAVLMLIYLVFSRQLRVLRCWPSWAVLLNGGFLAGFILFYISAMQYTSMANAILVIYLAPVVTAVFAHFFMSERLNLPILGLIFLALLGFLMILEFRLTLDGASDEFKGLLLALGGLACYSGFILINRVIPSRVPVLTRSWYQMLVGALLVAPWLLGMPQDYSLGQWGWLWLAGLVPGFLGIFLAVVALRSIPAATFGTLAYLEPITVIVLGWVLFAQSLTLLQLAGCALIIGSGIAQAAITHKRARALQLTLRDRSPAREI